MSRCNPNGYEQSALPLWIIGIVSLGVILVPMYQSTALYKPDIILLYVLISARFCHYQPLRVLALFCITLFLTIFSSLWFGTLSAVYLTIYLIRCVSADAYRYANTVDNFSQSVLLIAGFFTVKYLLMYGVYMMWCMALLQVIMWHIFLFGVMRIVCAFTPQNTRLS